MTYYWRCCGPRSRPVCNKRPRLRWREPKTPSSLTCCWSIGRSTLHHFETRSSTLPSAERSGRLHCCLLSKTAASRRPRSTRHDASNFSAIGAIGSDPREGRLRQSKPTAAGRCRRVPRVTCDERRQISRRGRLQEVVRKLSSFRQRRGRGRGRSSQLDGQIAGGTLDRHPRSQPGVGSQVRQLFGGDGRRSGLEWTHRRRVGHGRDPAPAGRQGGCRCSGLRSRR